MRANATDLVLPQKGEQSKWYGWWKLYWQTNWCRQKILGDIFRVAAFAAGLFQISFFPKVPGYDASTLTPVLMAGALYTVLKIAQPFRWQQYRTTNVGLLALDMTAAALLVQLTGGLHTPFILYTLVPVLTSALLKDYLLTVVVSAITAAYVLTGYIYNPTTSSVTTAQAVNDFLVYIIALTTMASLPYAFNMRLGQRLQSQGASKERRRLSRELHDGVCQELCSLRWQVQSLSKHVSADSHLSGEFKTVVETLNAVERDARGLLEVMRSLGETDRFLPNLRLYLEHLTRYTGLTYRLEYGDTDIQLAEAVELESAMICVEALENIRKHAGARNVTVNVRCVNGHVQIRIADDGCGFEYPGTSDHRSHGLGIMRERAESIGGALQVTSVVGQGTEVFVDLPVRGAKAIW